MIYNIEMEDFYHDMKQNISFYDTSDYTPNNRFGMPLVNKTVLGKMKDECSGKVMTEFIGLRSKTHAYKTEDEETVKKLKGVTKSSIDKKIQFEDYVKCLFRKQELYIDMNIIHSRKQDVFSIRQNKLALLPKDEKRYVCKNSINTLPYGHYQTEFNP